MKKSAISLLICVIMILSLCQSVFAADISAITTEYPDIHITANVPSGTKVDSSSIKATLDGKPLKVESAEAEDVSTEWIVLIDTSISSNTYFQAEKDSVIAILKSLGDDDTMKLYYFQEKTFKVLDGTESKEEAEKKIRAIKCNGQDTVFYDAIGTMVDAAEKSKADKKVCIIFSDGVDTLSNSSRESAVEKMKKSKTPIYGYYADSLDKKTSDAFNSFLKNSGGKAESFTPSSAVKQLTDKSSEKTVEINLKAEEPVEANDKAVLSIDMGNGKPIKKEFKSQQWEPQSETETQTAETESTSDKETE
ncbi:MAG: VWA domain-containing protein, partial [Clostridia bacterium]|nr:VWA domain-containing protein [Clostridia bacterium]